jgi:hypothetical protein
VSQNNSALPTAAREPLGSAPCAAGRASSAIGDGGAKLAARDPRASATVVMGVVIVNAAQYYNWQPANLWAAIPVSALLGIAFYHAVAAVERRCVPWRPAT